MAKVTIVFRDDPDAPNDMLMSVKFEPPLDECEDDELASPAQQAAYEALEAVRRSFERSTDAGDDF